MPEPMRALTLWQPWAWAVAHAGKDWENRTWPPPGNAIGKMVAIHAGLRWDREGYLWMRDDLGIDAGTQHWRGCVVAVATLSGFRRARDGIFVPADITSPWFHGPVGWKLEDVVTLRIPVHCRGAQGLWRLPLDVDAEVRRQVQEVRG